MLVGLFKTIFFLITFYYLFKIIGRLLLPYLMKKGLERMQSQQGGTYYQQRSRTPEGEVKVQKNARQKGTKIVPEEEGEYVDFEELN
ncbi:MULTISPECIES: DUF4834 family protein [unclassified Carboxylicivirga]|uniref:DUF4834 family protein n=1 Tax=Carboxylicivirga TaxID=1628153 RepID=UPI003D32604B